jgi:hypothetical protein
MEYREYFEEAQRSQRRRGPLRYTTNFRDGTLAQSFYLGPGKTGQLPS